MEDFFRPRPLDVGEDGIELSSAAVPLPGSAQKKKKKKFGGPLHRDDTEDEERPQPAAMDDDDDFLSSRPMPAQGLGAAGVQQLLTL